MPLSPFEASFRHQIAKDLARYIKIQSATGVITPRQKIDILFFGFGFHAILVYRFGTWIRNLKTKLLSIPLKCALMIIYSVLRFLVRILYGIDIDQTAHIGEGLYIGHFGAITIRNCCIGKNCSIHQQTTIMGDLLEEEASPTIRIGDSVWIGAHSTIQGQLTIGDGAAIAAGAVVRKTIPPNTLVMGNPAKVLLRSYNTHALL